MATFMFFNPYIQSTIAQLWATHMYATMNVSATDSTGNVYVTGSYSNPLTIYNADTTTFGTLASDGSNDAMIIKYNQTGTAQWAARIGGPNIDSGNGIAIDSTGNVYVTGIYGSNPITIYNADTTTFGTLTSAGLYDAFIVKYNQTGTAQWATHIGGTGSDSGSSVSVDSTGNVYVTGSYISNPITIYNADTTTFGTIVNSGSNDVFIVQYNQTGTAQWATHIGGTGYDSGLSVSVDLTGNVYVSGTYISNPLTIYNADTTTFGTLVNSGSTDAYIVKYNQTGTAQWATRISVIYSLGNQIATDSTGNVYVTGSYSNPLTIYNADTTTFGTLTSAGASDAFIVKYNQTGTAQWATRIGGTNIDSGNGIATDSTGNVYVTGTYNSNPLTIYNADTTTFGTLVNSYIGKVAIFIARYNSYGTAQSSTRINSNNNESIYAISAGPNGSLYIVGVIGGINPMTIYSFDGTVGGTLTSSTNDGFIVRYVNS